MRSNAELLRNLYVQNAMGLHAKSYFEAEKVNHGANFHPPSLGLKVTVESLEEPIDSSDSNPGKWNELASKIIDGRSKGFSAFVVIHGTDTLSYTAAALSFILENFDLPIVITGSQIPWVKKGVLCDARNNLIGAILSAIWRFGDLSRDLRESEWTLLVSSESIFSEKLKCSRSSQSTDSQCARSILEDKPS